MTSNPEKIKNSLTNKDLQSILQSDFNEIPKLSLNLDNTSNLEYDINTFLSISQKVKIELLSEEYYTLSTLRTYGKKYI